MPRFYFDVWMEDGALERDAVGVVASDARAALHECIDAVLGFPSANIARIVVKNDRDADLMVLHLKALEGGSFDEPEGAAN